MLHEVLRSSNSEKVVRAVKAIGKLSSRKSFEEILQLSKHPEWPVRAQAVKAIGQLELDEGLPLLREALSDRSYWVRRNAAEALVSLGEKGYEILAHPERFEDGFAQDMVRYQLQRLNGEGISPEGDRDSADPSQALGSESETGGWSSASSTT